MKHPILVVRDLARLEVKGKKELISCTFIATFEDKTQKLINIKSWDLIGLTPDSHLGETHLSKDHCKLYYKDWEKLPMFSTSL